MFVWLPYHTSDTCKRGFRKEGRPGSVSGTDKSCTLRALIAFVRGNFYRSWDLGIGHSESVKRFGISSVGRSTRNRLFNERVERNDERRCFECDNGVDCLLLGELD